MIQRDPKYYVTGYKGNDPGEAPFFLRALVFDGNEGDYNTRLVDEFNAFLQQQSDLSRYRLTESSLVGDDMPAQIVIVNASHDDLPTSYETARIFKDCCIGKGLVIPSRVVNTREELMNALGHAPERTLIMSQCVNKKVYNAELSIKLEKLGAVIVPGKVTAPGGVFSDKDSAYQLLSDNYRNWDKVARYRKVPVEGKNVGDVVKGIFDAIDELEKDTGESTFFVKPHEGGGGLGGFRISKTGDGYLIPDLSKVSGEEKEINPTFIDVDIADEAKLLEVLWIYRLFAEDAAMSKNYLKVQLPVIDVETRQALDVIKEYLVKSREKRTRKLRGMTVNYDKALKRLVEAISTFESNFNRRYIPLVNEHIDFGLWGLRAHYRLSRKGPVLETMYHRVFQLGFTEEGIGYVGSDNISNKLTGDLEIVRLGPVNEIMVNAIGGKQALFETLCTGAGALVSLAGLLSAKESGRVPLRLQIDLATISKRIGEGNADTARGLCLASRWTEFVRNATEWLEDSLAYYAWKKS